MLEFIGDPDGTAAPRLAQPRPAPDRLADLWHQLTGVLPRLAGAGLPAPLADPGRCSPGWWPRRSARGSRLTHRRGSMSARLLVSSISVRVALYRTLRARLVTPGCDA